MRIHPVSLALSALLAAAAPAATQDTAAPQPSNPPAAPAAAQQPAAQPAAGASNPAPSGGAVQPQAAAPAPVPRVDSLLDRRASMRGRIRIVTTNAVTTGANGARTVPELYLYLDGRLMSGSRAALVDQTPETWEVQLRRDSAASHAWEAVLGSPGLKPKQVRVGLGPAAGPEYARAANDKVRLSLWILRDGWVWAAGLFWLLMLALFIYLAATTGIIRDSPPPDGTPGDSPPPDGTPDDAPPNVVPPTNPARKKRWEKYAQRPYSLGRWQMAFWFFVVGITYVAIWVATGDYNGVITWQSLLLLGLATSTGVAARIVESRRRAEQQAAVPERARLTRAIDQAGTNATMAQAANDAGKAVAQQAAAAKAQDELEALEDDTPRAPWSRGFFADILNDRGEPSLARFQHFVWTLILGVVFLNAAYQTLALPPLEPVLLVLLGISGATYIGFKGVEHDS